MAVLHRKIYLVQSATESEYKNLWTVLSKCNLFFRDTNGNKADTVKLYNCLINFSCMLKQRATLNINFGQNILKSLRNSSKFGPDFFEIFDRCCQKLI